MLPLTSLIRTEFLGSRGVLIGGELLQFILFTVEPQLGGTVARLLKA